MSADTVDDLHAREDQLGVCRAVIDRLVVHLLGRPEPTEEAWWGQLGRIVRDARLAADFEHRPSCLGYFATDERPDGCSDDCGCCNHGEDPA